MWICKHCNNSFEGFSVSEKANHSKWCEFNPKRQEYLNSLKNARNCIPEESRKKQGELIKKARKEGKYKHIDFGKNFKGKHHTKECREKMSILKEYS